VPTLRLLLRQRVRGPTAVQHAAEVDVDHAVPVGERELLGLATHADPGVVEHQVEPPTGGMHPSDEVGDLFAVADVEPGASRDARAGSGQLLPETFGSLMLESGPVDLPDSDSPKSGLARWQGGRVDEPAVEDEGVWR
jgi:hypothetical protein